MWQCVHDMPIYVFMILNICTYGAGVNLYIYLSSCLHISAAGHQRIIPLVIHPKQLFWLDFFPLIIIIMKRQTDLQIRNQRATLSPPLSKMAVKRYFGLYDVCDNS